MQIYFLWALKLYERPKLAEHSTICASAKTREISHVPQHNTFSNMRISHWAAITFLNAPKDPIRQAVQYNPLSEMPICPTYMCIMMRWSFCSHHKQWLSNLTFYVFFQVRRTPYDLVLWIYTHLTMSRAKETLRSILKLAEHSTICANAKAREISHAPQDNMFSNMRISHCKENGPDALIFVSHIMVYCSSWQHVYTNILKLHAVSRVIIILSQKFP